MSLDKLLRIRQIASTQFPPGLASTLPKKGNGVQYLSVQTVIDMLNVAFGDSWSVTYSDPVVEPFSKNRTVVRMKATLSVDTYDPQTGKEITIIREGWGADTMNNNGEENITKSAQSDALKKAASTFGLDAQLRRNAIESQYYYMMVNEPAQLTWKDGQMYAFQKEWNIINEISVQHNLVPQVLNAMINRCTDGKDSYISPTNIVMFSKWLLEMFPIATTSAAKQPPQATPVSTKEANAMLAGLSQSA